MNVPVGTDEVLGARARQLDAALPSAGRKVDLALIRATYAQLWPDRSGTVAARHDLSVLLAVGADAGLWALPSATGSAWDRSAQPPLPTFVKRPRPAPAPTVGRSARQVLLGEALVPALVWAYEVATLTRAQLEDLLAVNRWLSELGTSDVSVVPREERSLEVFDDEKHVASRLQTVTEVWAPGRLDETLLRCHPSWSPLPNVAFGGSGTLLIAENRSTFWSLSSVVGEARTAGRGGPVVAVAWGGGKQLPSLLRSVVELPFAVERLRYFGDLDGEGLAIAVAAAAKAAELGLPPLMPARSLYELLASQARPGVDRTGVTVGDVELSWLPDTVRSWARELAGAGQRAAQEAVGRQMLSSVEWEDRL